MLGFIVVCIVFLVPGIVLFASLYEDRRYAHESLADEYKRGYTYIFKCGYDHVDTIDVDYDAMRRIVDTIECVVQDTVLYEFHKECKTPNTIYTITILGIYIEKEKSGIFIMPETDKDRIRWEKLFIKTHVYNKCIKDKNEISNIITNILLDE